MRQRPHRLPHARWCVRAAGRRSLRAAVLNDVLRPMECLLVDEYASDPSGESQTGSDVDDLADGDGNIWRAGFTGGYQRLATCDTDLGPQPIALVGHPVTHCESRTDSPLGVIFVRGRRTEESHQLIADEFLNGAPEALEISAYPDLVW